MTLAQETEMTPAEVDAFLGRVQTGTLSFAREGDPYAIPISYGYDATDRIFYLRLVSTPDSTKRAFLGSSPNATLVVYEGSENTAGESTYQSVVATGTLVDIEPSEMNVDQIEQYGKARRPLFEIWAADRKDLDIQLYEFRPDEMTGRRTEVDWDTL